MATEVIMPKLGQTMEEGIIAEWLVEEGQTVRRGTPIFKMESDKAVLDVNAPASGVLRKILVPQGQSAKILSVVGIIAAEDEDISSYLAKTGEQKPVAQPLAAVGKQAASAPAAGPVVAESPETMAPGERVFASPRARRLARLEGIPIEDVLGTGPNGRVVEQDVQQYLMARPVATPVARALAESLGIDLSTITPSSAGKVTREDVLAAAGQITSVAETVVVSRPEEIIERMPLTGIRARIAEKMAASVHTTAAFTVTTEADAMRFVQWREELKHRTREGERVPTFNDLLVRLVVRALSEFPYMNARLENGEITRYRQINIGVAVDTDRGLVVPVLKGAASLTLAQISETVASLITRARAGQLTPDDMSGGTFTITNLGMFEVDAFTPIINVPEVAILGVGRIADRVVARAGQVVIRPTVVLSLTVDHRAVDGAPAARFLQRLRQLFEEPLLAI